MRLSSASFVLRVLSLTLLISPVLRGGTTAQRDLLTGSYSLETLRKSLLPLSQWHPFPNASERKAWVSLPVDVKRLYVRRGEEALRYEWPSLPVTAYLDYLRSGRRDERRASERRQKAIDLVLAECVEGKGRFVDQLIVGLWLICEETSWVPPAHIGAQRRGQGLPDHTEPTIDLFSAETANLLAWTHYLLGDTLDAVSPLLRARMKDEVAERILAPGLQRDDFWWMWTPGQEHPSHHVNNWTPWICSNWLAAVLALEDREAERTKSVHKIMQCLDRFLNFYPEDGGCDEGPSYWGHAGGSLFECLELLSGATAGVIDLYDHPLIRNIGRFIFRMHIAGSYYVNFGDAPARVDIPAGLVLRFGIRINDSSLVGLGAAAQQGGTERDFASGSLSRQLAALFAPGMPHGPFPPEPLLKDVWLPQSQIMAARWKERSAAGLYLAAQGGHNDQSHNHNDVGSFLLYSDGEPVLIDVGVEAYTAKTFSKERYDIWTMQSAYHNLPTINGIMQHAGREYSARSVQYRSWGDSVTFSLDIAGAYPPEARVRQWARSFTYDRARQIVELADDFRFVDSAHGFFLSLITPCMIAEEAPGRVILSPRPGASRRPAKDVVFEYDGNTLTLQSEQIALTDRRLKTIWGDSLGRIVLKPKTPRQGGTITTRFSRH